MFIQIAFAAAVTAARVLFIGNSLTAANDLPGLVQALSAAGGAIRLECRAVTFPGYSLDDHWQRGDAQRAIAVGGWSFVVLQQGPSALPASRNALIDSTRRFDAAVRRVGAKLALYMVWPERDRRGDFDNVSQSYRRAAQAVNGLVLPVGDAWRTAWRHDARIALYDRDGLHPTPSASYLAALVIVQRLSGTSPLNLPATVRPASPGAAAIAIPRAEATLLQQAAAETNQR